MKDMDRTLDRTTARALADAGYLSLAVYCDMFGHDCHPAPSLVPEAPDDPHDPLPVHPAIGELIRLA